MTTQQILSFVQCFTSSFASLLVSLTKISKPVQVCCSRCQEVYNFLGMNNIQLVIRNGKFQSDIRGNIVWFSSFISKSYL